MLTQEERITALEHNFMQFEAHTIKSYQEMAIQVTLTKGLTETIIGRLAALEYRTDQRFDKLDTKISALDTKIDSTRSALEAKIGAVEAKVNSVEAKVDTMQIVLAEILTRLPEKL